MELTRQKKLVAFWNNYSIKELFCIEISSFACLFVCFLIASFLLCFVLFLVFLGEEARGLFKMVEMSKRKCEWKPSYVGCGVP